MKKKSANKEFPLDYNGQIGARVGDALPSTMSNGDAVVAALVNNEVVSLNAPILTRASLVPLTVRDHDGWLVFQRSMCFLLAMAAKSALPDKFLRIRHSIGRGTFAELRDTFAGESRSIKAKECKQIENALTQIIKADFQIETKLMSYADAVALFGDTGQRDKLDLLRHSNKPLVRLTVCSDYAEIFEGPLIPYTSLLAPCGITKYGGGIVLQGPSAEDPTAVAEFIEEPNFMQIHREHSHWGDVLGVHSVGELNTAVVEHRIKDVVELSEARHDREFARIASQIAERSPRPRFVLIAGPSSAGKTTSCKRLSFQLRVLGFNPVLLSTDDYFVDARFDPIGPDGKPDFEHVLAVDIKGLQADLQTLLAGGRVKRRTFDFIAQRPVWRDKELSLGPDDIICMEGIHGLNPLLTEGIAREQKFLVYLSAITQLGIDDTNFLSTTDNRLMRRIVRDNATRGHDARSTIALWPNVRRGEERWIFPFQKDADATFNSSLDYELAVLRPFVEPLLSAIKPSDAEYATARRLQGVLRNFHPIPAEYVPGNSILRESIGGSRLEI